MKYPIKMSLILAFAVLGGHAIDSQASGAEIRDECSILFQGTPLFISTVRRAEKVLGISLSDEQKQVVVDAHLLGRNELGRDGVRSAGIGNYTVYQLYLKNKLLKEEGGFSEEQRRALVEEGVVGLWKDLKLAMGAPVVNEDGSVSKIETAYGVNYEVRTLVTKKGNTTTRTEYDRKSGPGYGCGPNG